MSKQMDLSDSTPVLDIFAMPTVNKSAKKAVKLAAAAAAVGSPTPATMRMEFYDNGTTCVHPVTQYGLLYDCFGSKQRYNINYGVKGNDANALYAYQNGSKASLDEYNNLKAMTDYWIAQGLGTNSNAMMAVSKNNKLAGTGKHNLKSGARGLFYEIGAITILNGSNEPDVHLFVCGLHYPLTKGWTKTPHSTHASKGWEVKF